MVLLGRKVGVPEVLFHHLRKLAPDFVISRHPDAAHGLPSELYDRETAEERLRLAREVLEWVGKSLRS